MYLLRVQTHTIENHTHMLFLHYLKEQRPWFIRKRALFITSSILIVLWGIGVYSSWDYYTHTTVLSAEDWNKMLKPLWQAPLLTIGGYLSGAAYSFLWILRRYIYEKQHSK